MPSLQKLSVDIVDVRLGLAKVIGDLFVMGAFYGDGALPVPKQIRTLAATLAEDESVDVSEVITRIGAERWAETPAIDALVEGMKQTDSPEAVGDQIETALDSAGSAEANIAERIEGRHSRAALASPLAPVNAPELDLDIDLANGAEDKDPFAMSFANASGDTSSKSTAGEEGVGKSVVGVVEELRRRDGTSPISSLLRREEKEEHSGI
jgi:hypothetical protein